MVQATPLLLGALLVGALHMSAPDHWVTLCLLGKVARWASVKSIHGIAALLEPWAIHPKASGW